MEPIARLRAHRAEVLRLAQRYGAHDLRVFGSAERGEATPTSDLDLLVRMEPHRTLFDLIGFEQELQDLLGCPVQVVSEGGLKPHVRDRILDEAVPA